MGNPRLYFDNRLDDGAPVASSTATGFDVANLADWRPFTEWQPAALPATATVDAGAAKAVDSWGVWGHDLGSQGATIELRKSSDNFAANDVLVDSYAPTDDKPFVRSVSTADERYWRLRITGSTMPTLAIAFMGTALEIPSYLREGFDPVGRTPKGTFNRSVGGAPLGRTVEYEEWSQSLTFELLSWAWLRSTWDPAWIAHLRSMPFILSWDPAGHAGELALVTAKGGFSTPHKTGSYADLQLDVTGILA